MMIEEGWEQRAKCSCGHLWISDDVVTGDQAPCRLCSCILDMWEPGALRELTVGELSTEELERLKRLTRLMKEGEK